MDSSIAAKIDFSKAFKIAKLMLIIVIMIIIIYYFVVISVIKFCMRLPSPALGAQFTQGYEKKSKLNNH